MDQVKLLGGSLGNLPRRAQGAIGVVLIVTFAVLFLVLRAATHTDWIAVQANVKPEKAGKVTAALEEAKIPNELDETGTSVMVPKDQLSKARVAMAQANVLGAGGHTSCEELYGKSSVMSGSTTNQQKVNARLCAQNSIANDIESINGIDSASVNVVMPEAVLFGDEQSKATAAITISSGGTTLEQKQVRAIQQLAASTVKDLDPSDVDIVDDSGNLLTSGSTSGTGGDGVSEPQLKMRVESQYNQNLEANLQRRLEAIVGPGNVKVISMAELDMDMIRREVKDVGGDENIQGPKSAETNDLESLTHGGSATGGTTGAGGNIGGAGFAGTTTPATTATSTELADLEALSKADAASEAAKTKMENAISTRYDKRTNQRDYAHDQNNITYSNDEVREAITVAPGAVKDPHLAVFVDKRVPKGTMTEVRSAVNSLVSGTVRNSVHFADDAQLQTYSSGKDKAGFGSSVSNFASSNILKWIFLAAGLFGAAFLLRRALNQREYELLNPGDDILRLERALGQPIPLRELEAVVSSATSMESHKRRELQHKVDSIATAKPADVASQLRGWMHDTERR